MSSRRPKAIAQSPTDPNFVQNPYEFYESARALGQVVHWEDYGMPVAFGHAAARDILMHRRMGRAPLSPPQARPDHLKHFFALEDRSLLELEGQDHARMRRLVSAAFTTARIGALSPQVVLETDRLIGRFPDGPFDFMEHFAKRLPVTVITRLIGLPEEEGVDLLAWSQAIVAMYQARRDRAVEDAANAAARDFQAYLLDYIERRHDASGNDMLSALLAAEESGHRLSREEVVSTCVLLFNAGHGAMMHALGNGLATLLRHEQPHDVVMPHAITGAVEELLRFDPPLHLFVREAYDRVRIDGVDLAPGDRIGVCLAAANRDPEVFEDPGTFDPTRPARSQLSFGAGTHFCAGAALARLELQVALPALYTSTLNLRLVEEPRYADLYHFHGLERLMVERG